MSEKLKSVITSDMEGRIETFNRGAEELFGYQADEVIGKKRVSLFSPGYTVLEYVPSWLKTASVEGEYKTRTVFLRKDGTPIAAEIRITPTFRDGKQIGFCGVTQELEDVAPKEVAPNIHWRTKMFSWLVITRAPFLTAIMIPILIGAAWVAYTGAVQPFPTLNFWLALFAGIALHIAANTFNDYFDWRSGADRNNNNYFLPYSGGSRSIELGLINEQALFRVASIALLISASLAIWLTILSGTGVLLFGLAGAFLAYFYTAPPVRLAARRGLGELSVFLAFGPLATAGTVFALTGSTSATDFLIGVPIGLLTTAILWINQFPDITADKRAGKINLVVMLGKRNARWGYMALLVAAFGLIVYGIYNATLPLAAGLALLGMPLAIYTCLVLWREYDQRSLVRANARTIQLQMVAGMLMALGLALPAWLGL